jgi:hypothetical protein
MDPNNIAAIVIMKTVTGRAMARAGKLTTDAY